jgi:hypothetical protein
MPDDEQSIANATYLWLIKKENKRNRGLGSEQLNDLDVVTKRAFTLKYL